MQLTRFTDLGLRILMRLATPASRTDEGYAARATTTSTVAAQLAVSPTHAAKVVARLQGLGLVETRRGRTGGLAITDAGRSVSVGWLARELEGTDEVIECEGDNPCPLAHACRLRGVLRQAQEAFFTVLDPWTVEDLAATPTAEVLLTIASRPPEAGPLSPDTAALAPPTAPLDALTDETDPTAAVPTIPRSTGPI